VQEEVKSESSDDNEEREMFDHEGFYDVPEEFEENKED